MASNIVPHGHRVKPDERSALKGQKPCVIWFTGLPSSGKSTTANEVEHILNNVHKAHTYLLDGDNIRHRLNKDLGFSAADREENIRRIGEVASLFVDAGLIVLTAFISPFQEDRDRVRALVGKGVFVEVYVRCPVSVCETRDPKGMYKKARAGDISEFTGVSAPYDEPQYPELILDTDLLSLEECAHKVVEYLTAEGIILG